MDLLTNFIALIGLGIVSFAIEKFWGFNPYEAYTAIGVITAVLSIIYVMWPAMTGYTDINAINETTNRLVSWFVDFLPGAILGDFAGIIIAKATGDSL